MIDKVGIVIIGRNEGTRLQGCLRSTEGLTRTRVYVDSGSTDQSLVNAAAAGCYAHSLNPERQFTAARARNEGFLKALELDPELNFIQFIDGDCELDPSWLNIAVNYLVENGHIAAVSGRRRERFPEHSIYNQLCDWEWKKPEGESRSCGGDAMYRVDAFKQTGGFRDHLIAGEEPELCLRLRNAGWKIHTLSAEMTLHDAAMTDFSQWWTRIRRSGYAFAEGFALHFGSGEQYNLKESLRTCVWSMGPFLVVACTVPIWGMKALSFLLLYPLQVLRLFIRQRQGTKKDRFVYAFFSVLARFPEQIGQFDYVAGRITGRSRDLIEYK